MLNLFSGEEVLYQSADGMVTLTNRRIWQERIGLIRRGNRSIPLENIQSCHTGYVYYPIILLIGVIYGVAVSRLINQNREDVITAVATVAIVTSTLFLITRRKAIIVQMNGNTVKIRLRGMNQEELKSLAAKINDAKGVSDNKNKAEDPPAVN